MYPHNCQTESKMSTSDINWRWPERLQLSAGGNKELIHA